MSDLSEEVDAHFHRLLDAMTVRRTNLLAQLEEEGGSAGLSFNPAAEAAILKALEVQPGFVARESLNSWNYYGPFRRLSVIDHSLKKQVGFSPQDEFRRLSEKYAVCDKKAICDGGGGFLAGMTSASMTHFLDVAKVLRQTGKKSPQSFTKMWTGLPMGAFAQGQRFAVTLLLDQTLQKQLAAENAVLSFLGSMVAAGCGEFLANPLNEFWNGVG